MRVTRLTPEQVGEGVLEDGPEEHHDGGQVPREPDGGHAGEDDALEEVVDQDLVARLLGGGGGGDEARVGHGEQSIFTHGLVSLLWFFFGGGKLCPFIRLSGSL